VRLLLGVCRSPIPFYIYSVQVTHSSSAESHESNARFTFWMLCSTVLVCSAALSLCWRLHSRKGRHVRDCTPAPPLRGRPLSTRSQRWALAQALERAEAGARDALALESAGPTLCLHQP